MLLIIKVEFAPGPFSFSWSHLSIFPMLIQRIHLPFEVARSLFHIVENLALHTNGNHTYLPSLTWLDLMMMMPLRISWNERQVLQLTNCTASYGISIHRSRLHVKAREHSLTQKSHPTRTPATRQIYAVLKVHQTTSWPPSHSAPLWLGKPLQNLFLLLNRQHA